jgi:hypothetical protein
VEAEIRSISFLVLHIPLVISNRSNFLSKPIVAAINDVQAPGRLRNIQDDPFAVRVTEETVAGELLLTYDPTPGTWMYDWDNDMTEDAKFAVGTGFVFRHLPTSPRCSDWNFC